MLRKSAQCILLLVFCCTAAVAQPGALPPPPVEVQEAQREAEQARLEAERLQREADLARKNSRIARKQRDAALRAAEKAKTAAKAAEQRLAEAEKRSKALAAAKQAAARDAATALTKQKQRTLWGLGGAGVGLALLTLGAVLLLRRSRRQRESAEAQADLARREAVDAVTPVQGASDTLLEGAIDGSRIALKIPAIALNLQKGGAVIGRNPQYAAFVINHPSVSQRHCRLFVDDGVLQVEDLQSTNGTILNGATRLTAPSQISTDETLTLGEVTLTLRKL
jgi:hypothetical protein